MKSIARLILRHLHRRAHSVNFGMIGVISYSLLHEGAKTADLLFVLLAVLVELSGIEVE